jgi:hypothetical protein
VTADDVFSYRSTKDGKVFISWHGRKVTTLAGAREEQQLEMARVTGHFKHGNER